MKKRTRARTLLICLACTMLIAVTPAGATLYSGTVVDSANGKYAATDVRSETMSFDNATGTWLTKITFRGNMLPTTSVQIYLGFTWDHWAGWDRHAMYEIAVRGGKMTFVDRTIGIFDILNGRYDWSHRQCRPKVSLSRPAKVLLATVIDLCMTGVVPLSTLPTRLSYKTVTQDLVYEFPLLAQ